MVFLAGDFLAGGIAGTKNKAEKVEQLEAEKQNGPSFYNIGDISVNSESE